MSMKRPQCARPFTKSHFLFFFFFKVVGIFRLLIPCVPNNHLMFTFVNVDMLTLESFIETIFPHFLDLIYWAADAFMTTPSVQQFRMDRAYSSRSCIDSYTYTFKTHIVGIRIHTKFWGSNLSGWGTHQVSQHKQGSVMAISALDNYTNFYMLWHLP